MSLFKINNDSYENYEATTYLRKSKLFPVKDVG